MRVMRILGFRAHDLGSFSSVSELGAAAASYRSPCVLHLNLKKAVKNSLPLEEWTEQYARKIHDDLAAWHVSVGVFGAYFNPVNPDPEGLALGKRRFVNALRLNRAIGCRIVGTETGSANPDITYNLDTYEPEVFDRFLRTAGELVEAAEKYDAVCCFEPVARPHTICTAKRMKKVLDAFPRNPHLGVIFDPANLVPYLGIPEEDGSCRRRPTREAQKAFFSEALDAFGDKIQAVHVKDYYLTEQGFKIDSAMIGRGVLDWDLIMKLLDERHIEVPMTLENIDTRLLPGFLKKQHLVE